MNLVQSNLLSLILFFPTLTALVLVLLPGGEKKLLRWVAFIRGVARAERRTSGRTEARQRRSQACPRRSPRPEPIHGGHRGA